VDEVDRMPDFHVRIQPQTPPVTEIGADVVARLMALPELAAAASLWYSEGTVAGDPETRQPRSCHRIRLCTCVMTQRLGVRAGREREILD
jgi:hypothetical protein